MHVKFSLTLHYVLHLTTWIKKMFRSHTSTWNMFQHTRHIMTVGRPALTVTAVTSCNLQQFLKVGALISSCFLYNQVLISRKPNIWWYFLPFLLFLQNKNKNIKSHDWKWYMHDYKNSPIGESFLFVGGQCFG